MSVVCVYNDVAMREDCLDRSVAGLKGDGDADVEYVAVPNVDQRFASAGSALNYAARRCSGDVIFFVHQDVYIHSFDALLRAATVLGEGQFGLLGAIGVDKHGRLMGRMRDRAVLVGDRCPTATRVDSVDEVLFATLRSTVLREPMSEDPRLAWHAYAVELGARIRRNGLDVGAIDLPITHNSRTINLDGLEGAHDAVALMHPSLTPMNTTCGRVKRVRSGHFASRITSGLTGKAGNASARISMAGFRASDGKRFSIEDVRFSIDRLAGTDRGITVLNVAQNPADQESFVGETTVLRYGRPVTFKVVGWDAAFSNVLSARTDQPVLLTNLDKRQIQSLQCIPESGPCRIGFAKPIGWWAFFERTTRLSHDPTAAGLGSPGSESGKNGKPGVRQ